MQDPAYYQLGGNLHVDCHIGIAKRKHEARIVANERTSILSMSFRNTHPEAVRLLTTVYERVRDDPNAVVFCLEYPETIEHYGLGVLLNLRYQALSINRIPSDTVCNLYIRKNQTDQKDAFILAELLRMNQTEETCMILKTVLSIRLSYELRFAFIDQVSSIN